ncbi:MAG: hypothetical protein Q9191_005623 [Dirinaria sp. TL-2023a]
MKFSPVLPLALSSLATLSLGAPLREPAPVSAGRRRSESLSSVPEHLNARRASTLPTTPEGSGKSFEDEFASEVEFGVGDHLFRDKRDNSKRAVGAVTDLNSNPAPAGNEEDSLSQEFSDDVEFGVGTPVLARRDDNTDEAGNLNAPKRRSQENSLSEEFAEDVEFGVGTPVLRDRKRNNNLKREDLSDQFASDLEIGTGVGEPLIRRKVNELIQAIEMRHETQTPAAEQAAVAA